MGLVQLRYILKFDELIRRIISINSILIVIINMMSFFFSLVNIFQSIYNNDCMVKMRSFSETNHSQTKLNIFDLDIGIYGTSKNIISLTHSNPREW